MRWLTALKENGNNKKKQRRGHLLADARVLPRHVFVKPWGGKKKELFLPS